MSELAPHETNRVTAAVPPAPAHALNIPGINDEMDIDDEIRQVVLR